MILLSKGFCSDFRGPGGLIFVIETTDVDMIQATVLLDYLMTVIDV